MDGSPEPSTSYSKVVEEQQHQDYGAGKQGAHVVLLFIVTIISLIMISIGLGTALFSKNTQLVKASTTMWIQEYCITGSACRSVTLPDSATCASWRSRQRAIQGFGILSLLSGVVAAVFCVLDVVQRCPHHMLPLATFILLTSFTFLEWTVAAGSYHSEICGAIPMSASGYKLSVAFALFVCLWFLQMVMIVFYVIKRYLGSYKEKALNHANR